MEWNEINKNDIVEWYIYNLLRHDVFFVKMILNCIYISRSYIHDNFFMILNTP